MRTSFVLLGASLLLPSAAQAQRPGGSDALRAELERVLEHWGAPGTSVTVVRNGQVLFQEGFGHTRLGGAHPVTPRTVGTVASVTKTFGALAASILVADGAMNWMDPVADHVPEFSFGGPLRTQATTVHDLVTHRAGLPNVIGGLFNQHIGIEDLLEALPNQEPVSGLRQEVLYSQAGVALLGEVVARASGVSWPGFVRSRILEPLEMDDTRVGTPNIRAEYPDPDGAPSLMGRTVRGDGVYQAGSWSGFGAVYSPAGGIATSGDDMANYMRFLLDDGLYDGRQLIPPGTLDSLWKPIAIEGSVFAPIINPFSDLTAYGTGWYAYDLDGLRVVEHPGANAGSAVVALIPELEVGVFILSSANFPLDSERLVSALKFASLSFAAGLKARDWVEVLDR